MKALLKKIRKLLRDRRTRQFLTRTVSVIAAIVVFVTTYALVLPAITMETEALCGMDAHQHDESCYTKELVCGQEESENHRHTEDCYIKVLICGKEAHTHNTECYKGGSDLTVQMEADALAGIESDAIEEPDSEQEESRELASEVSAWSGSVYETKEDSLLEDDEPVAAESGADYDKDGESESSEMDMVSGDDGDFLEEGWDDIDDIEEGTWAEGYTEAAEGEGTEALDNPEEGESEEPETLDNPEETESEEFEAADNAEEGESEEPEALDNPEEGESEESETLDNVEEGEGEESEAIENTEETESEESEAIENTEEAESEEPEAVDNPEEAENEGIEAGENKEA